MWLVGSFLGWRCYPCDRVIVKGKELTKNNDACKLYPFSFHGKRKSY